MAPMGGRQAWIALRRDLLGGLGAGKDERDQVGTGWRGSVLKEMPRKGCF